MKKDDAKKIATADMYDTLSRPIITEKALRGSENGQVTFEVPRTATKEDVKNAVEAIFGVKIKAVNTVRQIGKIKRFRGKLGQRSEVKKAVVTLAEGYNIDVTTGI